MRKIGKRGRKTVEDRSLKSTYLLLLPTDILEQWRSGHRQYPRCRPFPVDDCRKLEKAFKDPHGIWLDPTGVIIACLDSPERHFAEVVRSSIVRLGTNEDMLTRAIVTRAEIDIIKVKNVYFSIYKNNMDYTFMRDTSGDYRRFLSTLLGVKN
ncbi:hypothetical protein SAY86_011566 [Trapa natans]|uniref:Annexin n=1 Tax=Trapa natans TaxID=22666 RepID=A0AAN7LWM1_TRANT|nr:hypothetical protein SAY86_011566 [Trapa natans]